MRFLGVLVASVLVATTLPGVPAGAVRPAQDVGSAAAAGPWRVGRQLPIRPRVPNRARFFGADDRYVLYGTGWRQPAGDETEYTLARSSDGRVVRTFRLDVSALVRLVDGAVVVARSFPDRVTRYDAATGSVTGSVVADGHVEVVDDEWFMTADGIQYFDDREPVDLATSIPTWPSSYQVMGDSDLAVISTPAGTYPLAIDTSTGEVGDLASRSPLTRVLAARAGADPLVVGVREGHLARWTDPVADSGYTEVPVSVDPVAGGLVGDELLAVVPTSTASWSDEHEVVPVDVSTGVSGPRVLEDVYPSLGVAGRAVQQAATGLAVAWDAAPEGDILLFTAAGIRDLGAPRATPQVVAAVVRRGDRVWAEFADGADGAVHRLGTDGWVPADSPLPYAPSDPVGPPLALCSDLSRPLVTDVRGRWKLEECSPDEHYVTDQWSALPPFRVPGTAPQLGADHVASWSGPSGDPDFPEFAMAVTGLDARHRTELWGPLTGAPSPGYLSTVFSVDRRGGGDPVYVDASGRVRVARPSTPADDAPPVITETRRPPAYVSTVRPVRVGYAATARDEVDGRDVDLYVQTRRARRGQGLGPWATPARPSDGRRTVLARPGEEWCFGAVAVDRSGNGGASGPARCVVVPLDDRAFRASPTARRTTGRGLLGGTATVLRGPRDSLTVPGASRDSVPLVWVRTGPGRGPLEVVKGRAVVARIPTASRRPGLRVVELPTFGVVRLEAGGRGPAVVDAVGHHRLT